VREKLLVLPEVAVGRRAGWTAQPMAKQNFPSLQETEHNFSCRSARSVVTILTELPMSSL